MYRFFPYIYLSGFSLIVLIVLGIYSLKYKHNHGVLPFILAVTGMAWWVFCQAFELMALTFPVKLFWANIEYLGVLAGLPYLVLSLKFSGYDQLITKRNLCVALCIYGFFYLMIFTDSYHGLMRSNMSLDTSRFPYVIDKQYGMLYPLYLLWTYGINFSSMAMIILSARHKTTLYKRQGFSLVFFIAMISITNIIYIIHIFPQMRYDMTPAITWIPALGLAWGILDNKLLDIMPLARDTLVEQLTSGVVVLDNRNNVVDINQAARTLLHINRERLIGVTLEMLTDLPLAHVMATSGQEAMLIENHDFDQILEIRIHYFGKRIKNNQGSILVITDVTTHEKNMRALMSQQKTISVIEERERVGRDLHDGIGQMFGFVNAQTQAIRENIINERYQTARFQTEALIEASQKYHMEIRSYILEMRGVSPRNRSFSATLKQYASSFKKHYEIPVQIRLDDRLPEDFPGALQGIQMLKIVQEALNNVQKHAGPCQVEVKIEKYQSNIILTVIDNGKGFDDENIRPDAYGFSIMKERAMEIEGELNIKSKLGFGTEITLKLGGVPHEYCHS